MPALALAQPKTADDWYKEGENQYNLGEFDKAAEAFKAGFAAETDESKKPAYLYNVAQAYKQAGPSRCRDAAFFFKRYLVLKDADTVKPLKPERRAQIEQNIAAMEECANTGGSGTGTTGTGTTTKPGGTGTTTTTTTTTKPGGTGTTTTTKPGGTGTATTTKPTGTGTTTTTTTKPAGTGTITAPKAGTDATKPKTTVAVTGTEDGETDTGEVDDGEEDVTATWDETQPKLVSARALLGGAYVGMGDLDVGVRAAFGIIGGYPVLRQEKLLVEAGIAFTATPINYRNQMTDAASRASLIGFMANGAATYSVMPKITARGDLGLGIMTFSGLDMGNPFTEGMLGTTGGLTSFAFRLGVSGDYEINKNLVATATPFALTYSPAKEGLRSDIGGILKIEFMVGVGYRM
jgi:hypothetical protein